MANKEPSRVGGSDTPVSDLLVQTYKVDSDSASVGKNRLEVAPKATGNGRNRVFSVHVADDWEVEWIWHHDPGGSYVSGYRKYPK